MSIELPGAIAAYFASDRRGDARAILESFTQDAIVVDEGNTYTDRDAIRLWMANASTKYAYTVEPFALSQDGEKAVVTSRLVGNFPGSPVNLHHIFVLSGNKIARLEIVPCPPS
jgi:ketosteroid isomerase-like protein